MPMPKQSNENNWLSLNGKCTCTSTNRPWLDWLRWKLHLVNYSFRVDEEKRRDEKGPTYSIRRLRTTGEVGGQDHLCICGRWLEALKDEDGQPTQILEGNALHFRRFADARIAEQYARRLQHSIPQAWEYFAVALFIGVEVAIALLIKNC